MGRLISLYHTNYPFFAPQKTFRLVGVFGDGPGRPADAGHRFFCQNMVTTNNNSRWTFDLLVFVVTVSKPTLFFAFLGPGEKIKTFSSARSKRPYGAFPVTKQDWKANRAGHWGRSTSFLWLFVFKDFKGPVFFRKSQLVNEHVCFWEVSQKRSSKVRLLEQQRSPGDGHQSEASERGLMALERKTSGQIQAANKNHRGK